MSTATRWICSLALAALASLAQQPPSWVEPTKAEPAGTRYRTFRSNTISAEVSYLLYLPPGYETNKDKRYPVVYWLHGLGGHLVALLETSGDAQSLEGAPWTKW